MKTLDKPAKQVKPPSTYVTGFCNDGNHSGTKNLSPSGVELPVCKHIYNPPRVGRIECMCWCHDTEREFQAMLAATGKIQITDSVPVSVLPSPSLRVGRTVDDTPPNAPMVSTPFGNRPPIAMQKGGRVARGELERLIHEVLSDPVIGVNNPHAPAPLLTPNFIANEIRIRTVGAYEPSLGAIHATLTKWSTQMLITVAEKPMRVTAMSHRFTGS